jgi:hypothetical protein
MNGDEPEPGASSAPTYQVEAYKVYDDSKVIQSKTYGDEEKVRAYK